MSSLPFFNEKLHLPLLLCKPSENVNAEYQTCEKRMKDIINWIHIPPKLCSYRVNTLLYKVDHVQMLIQKQIIKLSNLRNIVPPLVEFDASLPDVVLVHPWNTNELDLTIIKNEVIVDVHCGASILRGANIFAPGVLGMLSGTRINEKVSIYVDVNGKCNKGMNKVFECSRKFFIGNGVCKMTRNQLFGPNLNPSGIAVEVTDTISGFLPINENDCLPPDSVLLQNIPSIICSYELCCNNNTQEIILDMCASPGNKTTHISALTSKESLIIALDKTVRKVEQLKSKCDNFRANVRIFQADSTKICDPLKKKSNLLDGPPFPPQTFDKILLDAPCSGLGNRPQFLLRINEKVLKSYIPIQKKLFETAVNLLKPQGILVYSTCTITIAENEAQVAWALNKFSFLKLIKPEKHFGSSGFCIPGLNEKQCSYLQRFDSECKVDSIGFFIACFIKEEKEPFNCN